FANLFLFTGMCFMTSGWIAWMLVEFEDQSDVKRRPLAESLKESWSIITNDGNFVRLACVASCYAMSITLFPHYQAFIRDRSGIDLGDLVAWVIVQNIGAAAFSLPLGKIADRYGNRLALQITMLVLCAAPTLTVIWNSLGMSESTGIFYVIFFLLGLTPVSMRMFNNYTLEIAGRDLQPVYLSTLSACMAIPVVLLSALVGAAVDTVGFQLVFSVVVVILFSGWILTFTLTEPRSENGTRKRSGPHSTVLN
ncbi:MAG: MFS transporter, partial [Planctomycetota bacterium]